MSEFGVFYKKSDIIKPERVDLYPLNFPFFFLFFSFNSV